MNTLKFNALGEGFLGQIPNGLSTDWMPLPLPADDPAICIRKASAFWFEPAILAGCHSIKSLDRIAFILVRTAESWVLWCALPGATHLAYFESIDQVPGIRWETDSGCDATGKPVVYYAKGSYAAILIENAVAEIRSRLPFTQSDFRLGHPEWMSGLGWCSWDAFYYDVNESSICFGVESFKNADIKLGFVILDDGWQAVRKWKLFDVVANDKFKSGLGGVANILRTAGIKHFGVWHTLLGYWHGIDPDGPLSKKYRIIPVEQKTSEFKGWPENHNPEVRFTLHPDDAHAFYQAFYKELAECGVSFAKVDGQAAIPYFVKDTFADAQSYDSYQRAFQSSASDNLEGGAISCMANDPSILWRTQRNAVWRNSDDFYPNKPFEAHADHLYINLVNALFTRAFAIPDWDMFQSKHPFAPMHAVARAISGGPVYVSDKPGTHDTAILKRLTTIFGVVPQFPQPAKPLESTLLVDPRKTQIPLMIVNSSAGMVQLCAINCFYDPKPSAITARWVVSDIVPGVGSDDLVILHNPKTCETKVVRGNECIQEMLEENGGFSIWTHSPVLANGVAILGHSDIYAGIAVVERIAVTGNSSVTITFRHGGNMIAWSTREPKSIWSVSEEIPFNYDKSSNIISFKIEETRGGQVMIET